MKRFLVILCVLFLPYTLLAQGGVLTSDGYEEELRHVEQFQFSEEAAALMMQPLEAYPDLFTALSDFNFSFVRYNRRGYDYRYRNFFIDGVSLYDPMTGNQQWNLMGTVYNSYGPVESEAGLAPQQWTLGGLGDTRTYSRMAGSVPKRISVGMMFTDRRFRGGARAGISSGWMKGDWAIAVAGSRRWGRDQHIRGVYMDDWTVYASVAKKLGKRHTLSAAFFLAPSDRGVRGAATQEAFELTGDPLYNPYWGYQDGRIRSARTRKSQQPMALLAWDYKRDEEFKVHTVFSYLGGESSYSALDWFSVSNPTPDYYRYMPGYQVNPEVADAVTQAWQQRDPGVTQINWNELYYVNRHGAASPASYVVGSAVTANDRYGTFPFGLVVQDDTGGIEIKLSGDDLFLTYPIGQPIRIRCQGLVLGAYGGYVTLGSASADADYQNGFISQTDIPGRLSKRGELESVSPDTLRFSELEPKHVGCFVAFETVQFADEELGLAWCDGDTDSNRHLVNSEGDTLLVRTSRYARFADEALPVGSGYVEGILGWFNNSYQLRVIDARNVIMESSRF